MLRKLSLSHSAAASKHLSTHQNFLSKYLMMIFLVIMMIMTITVITVVWLLGNVLSGEK